MVIKVAYSQTPPVKVIAKRWPWPKQVTKPGRRMRKKLTSKWTGLQHCFTREMYTNWFGHSRVIFLCDLKKVDQTRINAYNKQLIPLGFNMAMGCHHTVHALRSSFSHATLIVYAFGNEKSPLGNVESLPLLRKVWNILDKNKKTPDDYVLCALMDRQEMSVHSFKALIEQQPGSDGHWQSIVGHLNAPAMIPTVLNNAPQSLVNLLDYYVQHSEDSGDSALNT